MKREDLITYKMMQRVHESPNGLMSADFRPLRSDKVHNYFGHFVRRGMATLHKEGWLNRYTVSDEQWAEYIKPITFNIQPKARAQVGDPTFYGQLLTLAARPGGVNCDEPFKGYSRNELSVRLSKLGVKGRLICAKNPRTVNQYFYHQADADAFKAAFIVPPKAVPKPKEVKPKIQRGSAFPATVKFKTDKPKHEQTKESARAKWNATPPHLPYDDAGRPLWKLTICPGFTTDPKFSNTHFQTA